MFGLFREGSLLPLVGVDFGTHSIKAVNVLGRAGKFTIGAAAEVMTPKGVLVDHQLQDIERVSHLLRGLKRDLDGAGQYVSTSVSGSNVITKILLLDAGLDESERREQMMAEAEQIIPFPLDEVSLDYEELGPSSDDPSRLQVLLSTARTESINGRVSALAEVGWTTRVVDVGAHALGRAVLACYPDLVNSSKAIGIIDVGAATLTFAALVRGEISYTRLQDFGGNHYTQSLASFYSMSPDSAEQAKVTQSLPAGHESDVTQPHISILLQHIKRNSQLFCSASHFRELSGLVLTGGGSLLPGLAQQLASELGMEVRHPDPFALFGSKALQASGHGARYMTAFGLALRSFVPCQM